MWHRKINVGGAAALLLVFAGASRAGAAGIVNGGFETGDFSGWTVQLHDANAPGGGTMQVGAQVLTGDDLFRDGSVQPGATPPQGRFFALISTMPEEDEPEGCPTTQSPFASPPTDVDSDPYWEQDVTVLSQQFQVGVLPTVLQFSWSFLRGESGPTSLHDDFQVILTPIDPPGAPIQVLGQTAGAAFPPPYAGTFQVIDPASFDNHTYEAVTDPAGGPADCHYSPYGRTVFQQTTFTSPAPGLWEVTFFIGDDGGDARGDSGVLLDEVTLITSAPVPVISSKGVIALVWLLCCVMVIHIMWRRSPRTGVFAAMVLLFGTLSVTALSRPVSGAAGVTAGTGKVQEGMQVAARRAPRKPTPPPTRPPTPPATHPATPTPANTPTPIVSQP